MSRNTQPQSRPGQRCRRAIRAGSASSATASAATAKRTRRGSSARPVEPEAAVLAADQRARRDRLRVGEAQPRRARTRPARLSRASAEKIACSAVAQAARELELLRRRPGRPATPSRTPQRSSESGSSSASVARDRDVVLGPVDGVGEVQRERAALQLDRFGGYLYH